MEIEYSQPGSIHIALDELDLASIREQGFTMDRQGFAGIENKTWMHTERTSRIGHAVIDADGDLHVYVPSEAIWSYSVPREKIAEASDGLIDNYLGPDGTIEVSWGTKE